MKYLYSLFMMACGCILLIFFSAHSFAEEIRIQHDELALNADMDFADDKRLADGIVVIVHGTLGHKKMDTIETLQAALHESGRNSLAINLSLGVNDRHGMFPCDEKHFHRAGDAIGELKVWIEWLEKNGVGDITLLGHSRGANQAVKFVLSQQAAISKLILLAPSTSEEALGIDEAKALAIMSADDWLIDIDFLHCERSSVLVDSYLSYRGPNSLNDTVSLLQNVGIPTLVISGSEDAVVTELSSRMAEVSNPVVSHIEIDGAGHFFRDLYAYDVVDAVDAFLDRQELLQRPIALASSFKEDAQEMSDPAKLFVVFVSQSKCEFCEQLRQQVLHPAVRRNELDERIALREVSLDTDFELVDFQGRIVKGMEFASRYGAFVTPTLLFLDKKGNSLVEPLVGIGNIEFFELYLERKIAAAAMGR